MGVWTFVQDQVLGMKLLNRLIGMGLSALGRLLAWSVLQCGAIRRNFVYMLAEI